MTSTQLYQAIPKMQILKKTSKLLRLLISQTSRRPTQLFVLSNPPAFPCLQIQKASRDLPNVPPAVQCTKSKRRLMPNPMLLVPAKLMARPRSTNSSAPAYPQWRITSSASWTLVVRRAHICSPCHVGPRSEDITCWRRFLSLVQVTQAWGFRIQKWILPFWNTNLTLILWRISFLLHYGNSILFKCMFQWHAFKMNNKTWIDYTERFKTKTCIQRKRTMH